MPIAVRNMESARVLYARRAFTFGGEEYKAGAEFDPAKAECSARRLRQMWDGRWLEHTKPGKKGGKGRKAVTVQK